MPNLCSNFTDISGPRDDVIKFLDDVGIIGADYVGAPIFRDKDYDGDNLLANIVPCPEELKETRALMIASEEEYPSAWDRQLAEGVITKQYFDESVADYKAEKLAQQRNLEKYGYAHWYSWYLDNIGTKWGDYDYHNIYVGEVFNEVHEHSNVALGYYTAWSPLGDKFWHTVSQKYPTLTFETCYQEEGMGFLGVVIAKNGSLFGDSEDIDFEYPEGDEDYFDNLSESIGEQLDRLLNQALNDLHAHESKIKSL